MIEAFVVYFNLLFLMLFFALKGSFVYTENNINLKRDNKYFIISIISVFLFSLVIGLRYYVGGDYVGYLDDYNNFNLGISYSDSRYELGYFSLMIILKLLGLTYPFLFIVVSFLQILFIYNWTSNFKYLLPGIIYFYFTTLYLFESMNIMRQALSFSILLFSTIYIHKSEKIKFIGMVLLASSFHKSSIFFLPFYFFVTKEWIRNKYIQIALMVIAFLSSQLLFDEFFLKITILAKLLDYQDYSQFNDDLFLQTDNQSMGIGLYFIFTIDLIIFLFSDKLIKIFKKESYIVYHNMFFIGALLTAAFGGTNSIALGRFMFYFVSFRIVVLSFLCYYLFSINKNIINYFIGGIIIISYLIWFISAISKGAAWCSPFQFIFQDFIPNRL